ncbi:LutC/YkgG family protein [Flavihumibacter solisilvae]|jgi:L-lactate dehydrogenase complex protein LldG|uniref:Lactate utilization protein B/C n=1 Tax=Flavihumibacter solisilvae TaxID=1349421 RepID=A0A0C1LL58_9BACT|nr:lactate utilization protein [Flavihumibacter solisilvae]KIC96073.1 lactate utilization protein B/C [Flavihumibacter solisilvae]
MNVSPSKENILKKIRKALSESTPIPFPASEGSQSVFQPQREDLELLFASAFTHLQGKFVFCVDQQELVLRLQHLFQQESFKKVYCRESALLKMFSGSGWDNATTDKPGDLYTCDASITTCEFLVARTGTIVMSAAQESGRTTSVYAPVHICIASTDQLVYDVRDGLKMVKDKYGSSLPSMITFASGPSRTADIEKTLVVGVHGPKEVYLFLVDELGI